MSIEEIRNDSSVERVPEHTRERIQDASVEPEAASEAPLSDDRVGNALDLFA
ncbi:MAG: hypothetical protein JXM71_10985 [Spirochaetales bacterium]|nr:hypothetical protein [Spirochaetales bacterium]